MIADATRMVENSIMLIQGPPGTGKTKTIVGIIDSILKTLEHESVEYAKIMVCAPSNCAVDEIINRILAADLIFTSKENLKGMISRVASPEYDGIPSMKPYTLREKARIVREKENIKLHKDGENLIALYHKLAKNDVYNVKELED